MQVPGDVVVRHRAPLSSLVRWVGGQLGSQGLMARPPACKGTPRIARTRTDGRSPRSARLALTARAPWRPPRPLMNSTLMARAVRSEEHTSELQSRRDLVCRLLLEKKKYKP